MTLSESEQGGHLLLVWGSDWNITIYLENVVHQETPLTWRTLSHTVLVPNIWSIWSLNISRNGLKLPVKTPCSNALSLSLFDLLEVSWMASPSIIVTIAITCTSFICYYAIQCKQRYPPGPHKHWLFENLYDIPVEVDWNWLFAWKQNFSLSAFLSPLLHCDLILLYV